MIFPFLSDLMYPGTPVLTRTIKYGIVYFSIMQLPRGTFHSIKKGILFRLLLDVLEKNRFTGYCTVSRGPDTCTLVLNSGIYILADYDKSEGEAAWQKILKLLDQKVDAGLTTLNTVQLQLVMEFNPHAVLPAFIRKSPAGQVSQGITDRGTRKRGDISGNTNPGASLELQKTRNLPAGTEKVEAEKVEAETIPAGRVPAPGTVQSADVQQAADKGSTENRSDIDRELETLDTMDIDEMTKKIRRNWKVTMEQLDLDYLVENREDYE